MEGEKFALDGDMVRVKAAAREAGVKAQTQLGDARRRIAEEEGEKFALQVTHSLPHSLSPLLSRSLSHSL